MASINFKKLFFYILTIQTIVISTTIYRYNIPLFPNEVTVNLSGLSAFKNNFNYITSDAVASDSISSKENINLTAEMIASVSKEIDRKIKSEKRISAVKKEETYKEVKILSQQNVQKSKNKKQVVELEKIKNMMPVNSINNNELITLNGFKKEKVRVQKIKLDEDIIKEEVKITNSALEKETLKEFKQEEIVDINQNTNEDEMVVYEYSNNNVQKDKALMERRVSKAFDQKLSPSVLKAISRESDKKIISRIEKPKAVEVENSTQTEIDPLGFVENNDVTIYDYTEQNQERAANVSKLVATNNVETRLSLKLTGYEDLEYRIVNLADENEEIIGRTDSETVIKNDGEIYSAQIILNEYPLVVTEISKGENNLQLPRKEFFNEENYDNSKGFIIVKATGNQGQITTGTEETKEYLDESFQKTNEQNAAYVVLKNLEPGLLWIRQGDYKRWINVRSDEVNFVKIESKEKIKRINLYKKEILGTGANLNIQGNITSLNSMSELKKIALNKFQGKTIEDKLQKSLYKISNNERKLIMNIGNETEVNIPSENVVSYLMNQTGLNSLENSCLAFVNLKNEISSTKVNGKLGVGNMFVDTKYIQKSGEVVPNPSEDTEWILIYGEGQGQIYISNEYSSGEVEQRTLPCIEDTVILDYK